MTVTAGPLAGPVLRPNRVRLVRAACLLAVRGLLRLRVEGAEHVPPSPVLYCFNHLSWADPLVLLAALPRRPRLAMFGPKEADMGVGARNRLITWAGFGVPYKPGRTDLIDTTRRVQRAFEAGWGMAIAGEGRIHRGERELLPLQEGAAYFALRARVPVVPVAINGTSWLGFRRRVRVRIGRPIPAGPRATREAVAALTARTEAALRELVGDADDPPPPGPFGRWLTELFNEWPEGERPEGERPEDQPLEGEPPALDGPPPGATATATRTASPAPPPGPPVVPPAPPTIAAVGLVKAFGPLRAVDGSTCQLPPGSHLRPARAQRLGQDDAHPQPRSG